MSDRVRLLGRGWEESLIGAFETPPAMPEDIYFFPPGEMVTEYFYLFSTGMRKKGFLR